MWIVPEREIGALMNEAMAFDAVEAVFGAMSKGAARNFPVIREPVGGGALYGFKSGFDEAGGALGLKSGGYWPGNAEKGLANHQSSIFLFDPETGRLKAVVGGNLLTALRTAAAQAVSLKHLAREDARVLGMVGAGHQAPFQLRAAAKQRGFEKVVAWNRTPEKLDGLRAAAEEVGLPFEVVSLEALGAEADVIVTIVSSFEAVLGADMVRPGTHIAAMGTDTVGKQELDPALVGRATVFTDELAQSKTLGEAQHAVAEGLMAAEDLVEIGRVINGEHPGRTSADEVTVFDGTGVGLQDLAVAGAVLAQAIENGIAADVDL
ncbi:MAG: iminosuccinate reductase BhcD [Pseudomonadota bacterium]